MNIDELKMVLETINNTTGLAKDMGTTWIWLHYGFKVWDGLLLLSVVAVVAYAIFRIVIYLNDGHDSHFIRHCRDRLGIGSSGYVTPDEYMRTTTKINELIDKHNEEKARAQ